MKRTDFTNIKHAAALIQYIINCINAGSGFSLYEDPNIPTEFYEEGTARFEAIQTAVNTYAKVRKKANKRAISTAMARGMNWLAVYADMVEAIANADANRKTREEAAANISQSFLTPEKLNQRRKGAPETPVIVGKNIGTGKVVIRIANGKTYRPTKTIIVAIEGPETLDDGTEPVVNIVNGLLEITVAGAAHIVFSSADGKGKKTDFKGLKAGIAYHFFAYGMNGKKQVSELSGRLILRG